MPPRARGWLASPRAPLFVAVVALALALPSLGVGMATEDFVLRELATRPGGSGLDLYATLRTSAEVRGGQIAGLLPWLTAPDLRLSFFRPLSSAWVVFDYRVLGDAVWLMHFESLLLLAGLGFTVTCLARRLVQVPWVGGLAGLIYAVDDAHGHAVGWLANRSAVLAALLGMAALWSHDRWRRDGARGHALLAPLLVAASLASSELGLGTLAYLAMYGLFLDRKPRAMVALGPAFSVGAAWAALYRALGHGASGSGIYLSPLDDPLGFATELPTRLGALLLGQLGYPPADAWVAMGDRSHPWLALGGLATLAVTVLASRLVDHVRAPAVRFAWGGMLLSLLPAAATSPSDRTLFFSGLGAAIVIATVIAAAIERGGTWLRLAAVPLAALHLLVAPVLLPWRCLTMARLHQLSFEASASAYATVATGDDWVIALTAPDYYLCSQLRSLRHLAGRGPSPAVTCLSASRGPVELEWVDESALSLRVPGGYLEEPFNRLFRSRARPLRAGERVSLGAMEAQVTESTPAGEPVRVTFRFGWPLASERLRFVRWNGERFEPTTPPRPGERRIVAPAAGQRADGIGGGASVGGADMAR
ncbi:MAG: hypothetical protein HYZ29_17520 [Myxococcales bacterium]|nr:hypothetical protein [Myxococcales bacterium]